MGGYNSTLPNNLSLSLHNNIDMDDMDDNYDEQIIHNTDESLTSSASTSLMGAHPPPLYEAALVGNWSHVFHRLQIGNNNSNNHHHHNHHPTAEVLYRDRSLNSPLHLACRRQPPPNVIAALLRAEAVAAVAAEPLEEQKHKKRKWIDRRVTVDGLTALHFACYCGASHRVVDMLIAHDESVLRKNRAMSGSRRGGGTGGGAGGGRGGRAGMDGMGSFVSPYHSSMQSLNPYMNRNHNKQPLDNNEAQHPLPSQNSSSSSSSSTIHQPVAAIADRRGRTPLHCACSGFRTPHRPAVVRSLLRSAPQVALSPDEKGRTPLGLLYADYAEEIEEVLGPDVTVEEARRACGLSSGSGGANGGGSGGEEKHGDRSAATIRNNKNDEGKFLEECWTVLVLLLRAAHLGSVPEAEVEREEEANKRRGERVRGGGNARSGLDSDPPSSSSSSSSLQRMPNITVEEKEETEDDDDCDNDDDGGIGGDDRECVSPLSITKFDHCKPNVNVDFTEQHQYHKQQQQQQQQTQQQQQKQQQQQQKQKQGSGSSSRRFPSTTTNPSSSSSSKESTSVPITTAVHEVDLNSTPFQILHAASAKIHSVPRGFFRLILKVVDVAKAARERDSEFRLPLHLAVMALPPLPRPRPPPSTVSKESCDGDGGGEKSRINFGSGTGTVSSAVTSNFANAIERGNHLIGRHLTRSSSIPLGSGNLESNHGGAKGGKGGNGDEKNDGEKKGTIRTKTRTHTTNGRAEYRYSDGVRLSIRYRGAGSIPNSSSSGSIARSVGSCGSVLDESVGSTGSVGSAGSGYDSRNMQQQQQISPSPPSKQQQQQQYSYQERTALPLLVPSLLELYPEAASIPDDETGKYPLISALETGKPYHEAIEPLVASFPQLLVDSFPQVDEERRRHSELEFCSSIANILTNGTSNRHQHAIDLPTGLSGFLENDRPCGGGSGHLVGVCDPLSCGTSSADAGRGNGSCSSSNFVKAVHESLMLALMSPNVVIRNETTYTVGHLMKLWVVGCDISGNAGIGVEEGVEDEDGDDEEEERTDTPPIQQERHQYHHLKPSQSSLPSSSNANLYQVDEFLRRLIKASGRYGRRNTHMGPGMGHINNVATFPVVEDDDMTYPPRRNAIFARQLNGSSRTLNVSYSSEDEDGMTGKGNNNHHHNNNMNHKDHLLPRSRRSTISLCDQHNAKFREYGSDVVNLEEEWGIQTSMLRALSSAMTQAPKSTMRIPDTPKLALDAAYSMLRHEDAVVRDGAATVVASALHLLEPELGSSVVSRVVLGRTRSISFSTPNYGATGGGVGTGIGDSGGGGGGGIRGAGRRVSLFIRGATGVGVGNGGGGNQNLNGSLHSAMSGFTGASRSTTKTESSTLLNSPNVLPSVLRRRSTTTIEEPVPVRHGRAVACYRILSSPAGIFLRRNPSFKDEEILYEIRHLIRTMLLDPSAMVRKAACLCVGPILSFCSPTTHERQRAQPLPSVSSSLSLQSSSSSLQSSSSSLQSSSSKISSTAAAVSDTVLRDLRPSILKCMRTTEDPDVHLHLARGLISAARYRNRRREYHHRDDGEEESEGSRTTHYFVTRTGTPILEGALMLASSSPTLAVRNLFGAFLWVALGMDGSKGGGGGEDDGGSNGRHGRGEGLAAYMELAEGENGKIMMGLVTKTLVRIESVREGSW